MDLEEAILTLKGARFSLHAIPDPDPKSFGNWILIGTRGEHLAVRVTNDRDDILLDLMPRERFDAGPEESDWYNWDVVARALGIDMSTEADGLRSFVSHFLMIDEAFSPQKWQKTAALLTAVEADKRRRFMEGNKERRVPAHS